MTQDGDLRQPTPPDAPQPEGATTEELVKELADRQIEINSLKLRLHHWEETARQLCTDLHVELPAPEETEKPFPVGPVRDRLIEVKREAARIRDMLQKHLRARGVCHAPEISLSFLVEIALADQLDSLRATKTFRTEVITQLRAIAFVLESCIGQDKSGPTHHEKNVRLRGVVEQIQKGIARLDEIPQRETHPDAPPF